MLLALTGCGEKSAGPAPRVARNQPRDPLQAGQLVYERYGCALCHGSDGKSGIPNPNAKTAEKIPPVIYVEEGYTADELKQFIRRGQPAIDKKRADGPTPPFRMPSYGPWIKENELDALQKYLFSLMPQGEKESF